MFCGQGWSAAAANWIHLPRDRKCQRSTSCPSEGATLCEHRQSFATPPGDKRGSEPLAVETCNAVSALITRRVSCSRQSSTTTRNGLAFSTTHVASSAHRRRHVFTEWILSAGTINAVAGTLVISSPGCQCRNGCASRPSSTRFWMTMRPGNAEVVLLQRRRPAPVRLAGTRQRGSPVAEG